ncbi:MAG: hypothetical protein ACU0E9_08235 [Limimaricola soesokkakensis]|uniref:hypothetical protein n=1 Tax=Limimaricola soesokkakensis TaxID=1343159 RepID=UPI0040596C2A
MAVLRFLLTATACAGAAIAIGQFMESGVSRAAATPVDLPETYPEAPVLTAAVTEMAPRLSGAFDLPQPPRSPARLARLGPVPAKEGCDLRLSAQPRPGAIAELQLAAPCAPLARVTLRHQGLTVTLLTDAQGEAGVLFPALSRDAVFMAEAGGAMAVARTELPDMAEWHRVALQWRDGDGLSLHALAPGARYGEPGHVSRDMAPGTAGGASMIGLGDPAAPAPRLAEIYSAPVGDAAAISVEIEVTATNCGSPVAAELVRVGDAESIASTDIEVTLPGCDAVGELLVLQNLEPGLTVASR